jgi:hypothetical protein
VAGLTISLSITHLEIGEKGVIILKMSNNQRKGNNMITTTETAHKRIEEILQEKKDAPQGVRVFLQEGG